MGQKLGNVAAGVLMIPVLLVLVGCLNWGFDRAWDTIFKKPPYQARPGAPAGAPSLNPAGAPARTYQPAPQGWNDRPKTSRMCYTCGGSGNRTCGSCFGSGRDSGKVCSVCSGRGSSGSCGLCSGTGRVTD